MNEQHNPWTIVNEKEVYNNPWINVTEFDVLNPAGGKGIYGKVHFKNNAIGIIVLDDELNTYLVGQYRFPLNKYSWEIPEGGGPLGIDALESAKRELKEETGLVAQEWTKLLDLHLSNSVTDEFGTIFMARGLQQEEAMPEETEQLVVKKVPFDEAYQMVENGTITDSIAVAAILKVRILLLEGKLT
ncbi:NUDIX domain-containing protein [Segetibacter aerophilus]|uniref:GDP-mannose pyrophosphatase n=1 Tax=Segetibacter aerophilus TaxID=670293 RepID=A0A512B6D9_9BACT|nr:NUDIX hydrolase [Segetibacter aerophilus]GEO07536.1 DNA mismatch repair protein MutT [Segetibacter aerophilus]